MVTLTEIGIGLGPIVEMLVRPARVPTNVQAPAVVSNPTNVPVFV